MAGGIFGVSSHVHLIDNEILRRNKRGSIIFPTMGSLQNRRKALRKIVGANNNVMV